MLRRLQIRDFAIVDHLELEFAGGFGALTGETGAGKSILVDALALALGERGDAGAVRAGAQRADIAADFAVAPDSAAATWLADNDFADEPGQALLRRVIDAGGRSRAYINGGQATVAQLKELGERLADIHGQHAHHALLRADAQRELLDAHGGLTGLAREVAALCREWRRLRDLRERAESEAETTSRERELLDWQLAELQRLGFDAGQWQALEVEHRRLAHGATLLAGLSSALETLDEAEPAVLAQVERIGASLAQLARFDARLEDAGALLQGVGRDLGEAVRALRRHRDALDMDPDRLAEVEARIAAVTELARKHRVAPEGLPEVIEALDRRRSELGLLADAAALAEREAAALAAYRAAARRLSAGRAAAAEALSAEVATAMQSLGLAGGSFAVGLDPLAEGSPWGLEAVEFQVAAGEGQPLRPLARVASGGELSRIGLALQVIASDRGGVPTLVFDEVDVGIGGAVAEVVGRLLRELGRARQVLCVTHLPQVAAQAQWQWSVAKEMADGAVASRVRHLALPERVEEIARMLGGVTVTETTRRHAREMLETGRRGA